MRLQESIAERNIDKYIGKTYRVLCDSVGSKEGFLSGKTSGTAVIEFEGDEDLIGNFVDVKVLSYSNVLCGTIIK